MEPFVYTLFKIRALGWMDILPYIWSFICIGVVNVLLMFWKKDETKTRTVASRLWILIEIWDIWIKKNSKLKLHHPPLFSSKFLTDVPTTLHIHPTYHLTTAIPKKMDVTDGKAFSSCVILRQPIKWRHCFDRGILCFWSMYHVYIFHQHTI